MSKELQKLTNGQYTLTETENENQFLFFRNDNEVLAYVGSEPLELFARYLIEKDKKGELRPNMEYKGSIAFEISYDHRKMRMTISDNQSYVPEQSVIRSKKSKKHFTFFEKLLARKR